MSAKQELTQREGAKAVPATAVRPPVDVIEEESGITLSADRTIMAVISPQTTIWFIKLGGKGNWEKSCIEDEGTIRIGYENPYHENSLAGDWEPVYACCLAWRNEHHFVFIGSTPYTIWLQDAIEVDGFVTGVQIAESWPLRR